MLAAALPAPRTTVRPAGRGGRRPGSSRAGSAAATAASNSARRKAGGSCGALTSSPCPLTMGCHPRPPPHSDQLVQPLHERVEVGPLETVPELGEPRAQNGHVLSLIHISEPTR